MDKKAKAEAKRTRRNNRKQRRDTSDRTDAEGPPDVEPQQPDDSD